MQVGSYFLIYYLQSILLNALSGDPCLAVQSTVCVMCYGNGVHAICTVAGVTTQSLTDISFSVVSIL